MNVKSLLASIFCSFFLSNDLLLAHVSNFSNSDLNFLTTGYYVVIGAYSINKENYAVRYANLVKEKGYNANYGFSRKKNLYFVYLDATGNYRESIVEMRETRKIKEFSEAWVFVCLDSDKNQNLSETQEEESEEIGTRPGDKQGAPPEPEIEKVSDIQTLENENLPEKEIQIEKILSKNILDFQINTLAEANVFFNLYNAQNKKDVMGEVQIVDSERAKLIDVVQSGSYIDLPDPKNRTGKITLIVDVFGYRRAQFELNYYNPVKDADKEDVELLADVLLVNLDLVRYHVGDLVTMYNVYFFKDAALMRPESKFEVNSLLDMLRENDSYKIKIHGHVNGKHPGKIISKAESSSFFALNDRNSEGFGSAKELSLRRAELIRDYLVQNGIDESRMEIKAWGGKRMIHNRHSSKAKENVRVEIEILAE